MGYVDPLDRGLEMTSSGLSSPYMDDEEGFRDEPIDDEVPMSLGATTTTKKPLYLRPFFLVSAVALCLVLVLFVAVLGHSSQQQSSSLTTEQALDNFQRLLNLPYTLQRIEQEPDSAPALAMEWLRQDPNLTEYPQSRLEQRFALATLYHSLSGPKWPPQWQDSWLSYEVHECNWEGNLVRNHRDDLPDGWEMPPHAGYEACGQARFDYHRLILSGIETLAGTLPPEISLLTALQEIELTEMPSPMVLGALLPIPQLQTLTDLTRIDLTNLQLTGSTLPTELGLLNNLKELHIPGAGLIHTLPTELTQLTRLETLSLYNNQLTGTLPAIYGPEMPKSLEVLWLYDNLLSGPLPIYWGELKQVETISLKNNALTGTLPENWNALTSLIDLRLEHNHLQGTIPPSYGIQLWALKEFGLEGNAGFTGTVPEEWCRPNRHMTFWLDCHQMTCCGDDQLGLDPSFVQHVEDADGKDKQEG